MPIKAMSAVGGSGLAGSIVTIIIAFTGTPAKHGVPPEIFTGALVTIISSIMAGVAAYFPKMENQQ